jgi:hypothetical protein
MKQLIESGIRLPPSRIPAQRGSPPSRCGEPDAIAALRDFYCEAMAEPMPDEIRQLLADLAADKRQP